MDILEKFKDYLKQNELKAPSFHPYFEEALNYMLQAGGKHFRAQLLLGVVSAVDERRFEGALAIAMALEMIHTYSLIHDDLPAMDDDALRRGKATNHVVYGDGIAILAGDALLTLAFTVILRQKDVSAETLLRVVDEISRAAGAEGMVGGTAGGVAPIGGTGPTCGAPPTEGPAGPAGTGAEAADGAKGIEGIEGIEGIIDVPAAGAVEAAEAVDAASDCDSVPAPGDAAAVEVADGAEGMVCVCNRSELEDAAPSASSAPSARGSTIPCAPAGSSCAAPSS